jgi:hypothetical protein
MVESTVTPTTKVLSGLAGWLDIVSLPDLCRIRHSMLRAEPQPNAGTGMSLRFRSSACEFCALLSYLDGQRWSEGSYLYSY